MLYLLDANILITAERDYYPIDRIPEYWEWILHEARNSRIKLPSEIMGEITEGKPPKGKRDPLLEWLSENDNEKILTLDEEVVGELLQRVIEEGYAPDLDEVELETIGKDPFVIAYAMARPGERRVVTLETSKSSARRTKRKIPDVCNQFQIVSVTPFQLIRELGFRTTWRS